jgi:flavin reductase (DIM6/NTAB) family NADH-FMN oxidoreductase RutF
VWRPLNECRQLKKDEIDSAKHLSLHDTSHMELDLEGQHADRAYAVLASLVTPRPIAWVTTLSPDGVVNAAPFSFFNVLGAEPPSLASVPEIAPAANQRIPRATCG